ncbi:MAG TPA: 4-oxalomesaconate tautomerase [Acidimicrobiales bacterium]|nr:4-oxalomesaconate tautomerase [Acidimicrobiales bacterium]
MPQTAIRCAVLRGGTSKGLYFLAEDLPDDTETRDAVLLAAMGSPDAREIDGMGGGHPLTSKVAIVKRSERDDADVDYLFLQVWPDRAEVSDNQNCGNILAGVGPFALEARLLATEEPTTSVRIWMENTESLAVAHVETPDGVVRYDGTARIDGVPGSHAPVPIDFLDVAGSSCGALLPTKRPVDLVEGVRVTCIDNGMPVVCMAAADLGLTGYEEPADIEADAAVKAKVESIRLAAGPLMNLGDVTAKTVPKMTLLAPAKHGGVVSTRTFIPHRVHEAIGVFGAVSVATACLVPGSVAAEIAGVTGASGITDLDVEHPTGFFTVSMDVGTDAGELTVRRAALLRTARLLMRGEVLVPVSVWAGP